MSSLRLALLLFAAFASAAAQSSKPNILFAISDDQSWMHAGAYGDKATRTPTFDRVAREGVLFRYAYTAAPSCAPSRSAILTGRHVWELEEGGILLGILREKFGSFTHRLRDAGYQLGSTGKTWGPGNLDGWTLDDIFGKRIDTHKLADGDWRPGLNRIDYAANFNQFFDERDPDKPFFFWLGTSEPHQSYDVGGYRWQGKRLEDALLPSWLPDNPVTRGEILDYGVEIEHFDSHLGRALATLEAAGELDNTLIIVTSDHGNPLPRSKCNLYDGGVRVPLAMRLPGKIPGGRSVDDFVSLTDIAPTLLELAGAEFPDKVSGSSLWPILSSTASGIVDEARDFVVTAFERHTLARRGGVGYPMRSIRTHRYAYIRNYEPGRWPAGDPDFDSPPQGRFGDVDRGATKAFLLDHSRDEDVMPYFVMSFGRRPAEELYDMEKDPEQLHNIADDADYQEVKQALAKRLEDYLVKHGDPRQQGLAPWDGYSFSTPAIRENPQWLERGRPTDLPQ